MSARRDDLLARLEGAADPERAAGRQRQAIGWALRQHARVDPATVVTFVDRDESSLSGLSEREALHHLR